MSVTVLILTEIRSRKIRISQRRTTMNPDPESEPSATAEEAASVQPASPKSGGRKRALLRLAVLAVLCGGGYWGWATFLETNTVATENAYTSVEVAQVTPLVGGPVKEVRVMDTHQVKAGDILVVLDDSDARIAVAQGEAALATAQRNVRQLFANDCRLDSEIDAKKADIQAAEADLLKAEVTLEKAARDEKRRGVLVGSHAISEELFNDSQTLVDEAKAAIGQGEARIATAKAALEAAKGAREANAVLIADTTVETHPEVQAAAARLDQARLNLSRTILRAPVDGVVTRRAVEVGQQVQAGASLMTLVPLMQMHVDANFKESQLLEVRVGQPVHLVSDLYGKKVVYTGKVTGFSGGTGSALATIPAQNATGNWIKVVQRLPIRVELDPAQLAQHPLEVGLSMHATVELGNSKDAAITRR
jgi:membrane fusion protein (multidrug efflux system)